MRAPTFEECLSEAIEEHVRSWFDQHPPGATRPQTAVAV